MNNENIDQTNNPLSTTDASMVRVLEDLIDILIDRGLIQFTDFPQPAQKKLLERRLTREKYRESLQLLADRDSNETI